MTLNLNRKVAHHYARGDLLEVLLQGLAKAGLDTDRLSPRDLAPVDEFHIGGRRATVAFAEQLRPAESSRLLDVGCGIGGASRFFAEEYGCHVTGVDLTPEFVAVAGALAAKVGLADRVRYREADATQLPFADHSFDGAYMMHVGMNIPDKAAVFAEMRRVVKPGGVVGVYDILAGSGGEPLYPAPWATAADASFLVSPADMRELLTTAGFTIQSETDRTAFGIEFFQEMARTNQNGPPPFGMHLLFGDSARVKVTNMVRNVEEQRVAPWAFICR
ncbi:MAG: class I SAM-dependent methyltransferase [Planctomycetota bacterium]|jgi:ubiquinone/menaquinone biosynthesis C-methylase UbiE